RPLDPPRAAGAAGAEQPGAPDGRDPSRTRRGGPEMTTELRGTILSVDLDDLACYHAIHGLPPPAPEQAGVVLERCLPRFLRLLNELGARATFFVVGRDLERDMQGGGHGAALLGLAARSGHELANHSYSHAYDLVDW